MKKYKTIKEEKAYIEGYDDGAREQAHVFEDMYESAEDIKNYSKYGEVKTDWVIVLLIVLLLGVVASIIF